MARELGESDWGSVDVVLKRQSAAHCQAMDVSATFSVGFNKALDGVGQQNPYSWAFAFAKTLPRMRFTSPMILEIEGGGTLLVDEDISAPIICPILHPWRPPLRMLTTVPQLEVFRASD